MMNKVILLNSATQGTISCVTTAGNIKIKTDYEKDITSRNQSSI